LLLLPVLQLLQLFSFNFYRGQPGSRLYPLPGFKPAVQITDPNLLNGIISFSSIDVDPAIVRNCPDLTRKEHEVEPMHRSIREFF
jgi:hypothetical protein